MEEIDMVRLSVPGTLRYRDVVLHVVASACRALRPARVEKQKAIREGEGPDFEAQLLSAVSEAFNNVAIHAYRDRSAGPVDVEIEAANDGVIIRIADHGEGYDPVEQPLPDLSELPESNMGLYIMRSCMDRVSYRRGAGPNQPNVLTLFKHYADA
jgi:serine/threonine-protein kinase RsbW